MSARSDGTPSNRADAPVAMMSVRQVYSVSDTLTLNGVRRRSTDATLPRMISVPNRSACSRICPISSGPMIPSRNPGKFSTSVVSINCPPASSPSIMSGLRLARAEYNAAVSPAGPEPMTMTSLGFMMRVNAE
jgi:hypothetical protein